MTHAAFATITPVNGSILGDHFAEQYKILTGIDLPDYLTTNEILDSFAALMALYKSNQGSAQVLTDKVGKEDPVNAESSKVVTGTDWLALDTQHFDQITEKEHATHRGETVSKSTVEKPCILVWNISAEMTKVNPQVRRKDIISACVEAGVAFYTARTQYQAWLTIRKMELARENATKK